MPVLKAYIVEDDPRALKRAQKLVGERNDLFLVGAQTDPTKALVEIAKYKPDLVILDLDMNPINGWQVLEELDENTRVILTTVEPGAGERAYKKRVTYYLTKPYSKAEFDKGVDRVWEGILEGDKWPLPPQKDTIWLTSGGVNAPLQVYLPDIEAVLADGNSSKLYYTDGATLIDQSLKEMEKILPPRKFMRIHKKYIISLNRYKQHCSGKVTLQHVQNEAVRELEIGETYARTFYDYLAQMRNRK